MNKYVLSNKAVEDLTEIWYYTYHNWSEKQADKYYELLIYAFDQIAEKPDLGRLYSTINPNIFGLNVGKHIIFYQQTVSNNVEIVRILHEQMDYKNRLKEK
jgi:toxin ParE1/3/4